MLHGVKDRNESGLPIITASKLNKLRPDLIIASMLGLIDQSYLSRFRRPESCSIVCYRGCRRRPEIGLKEQLLECAQMCHPPRPVGRIFLSRDPSAVFLRDARVWFDRWPVGRSRHGTFCMVRAMVCRKCTVVSRVCRERSLPRS